MKSNEYFTSIKTEVEQLRTQVNSQSAEEVKQAQLLELKGLKLGSEVDAFLDLLDKMFEDF